MLKKSIWAVIAVFLAWSILDFLIHNLLLKSTYEATANLWRPEDEMNMLLMSFVTLVFSICFVAIYTYLINPKSLLSGIQYGLIFGVGIGASMGFGTYCYMPIPMTLAVSWFIASVVELTVAGSLTGLLVKAEQ